MKINFGVFSLLLCVQHNGVALGFTTPLSNSVTHGVQKYTVMKESLQEPSSSRRDFMSASSAAAVAAFGAPFFLSSEPVNAASVVTTAEDGLLPDLPKDARQAYLQYRTSLQISADYYLFDLFEQIQDTDQWGEIGQVFRGQNARGGQGQPSALERNFINPMRILSLTMPPDTADELRAAQFEFERGMNKINKATAGIKRDLPIEISKSAVPEAMEGWETGRIALNSFFTILNETTGIKNEMKTIPKASPTQIAEYGRSPRKYNDLMKKTRLCQNRGGPTLSAAWGQLMISGYMQDSCGIPDMEQYFFQ